ncbi:MAG: hemolysin family protein [Syntrophales bacterium]
MRNYFGPHRDRDKLRLEREIQSIINEGEENGLIDQNSGEMIQSILEFRETVVREVMVPRTEMVALPSDANMEEIIECLIKFGHTRMPVYSGNLDNIIGILNVKDLLKFWSRPVTEADIIASLRKPYFIPETKNIQQLLPEFKHKKSHMAIVIDEYGGTSGLVTLEDLLEEIVGEIRDEHDLEEKEIIELPDGYTLVEGRTKIEDIEEYFKIDIPQGKYETLGGFILHLIRRIPLAGEIVSYKNLVMTIESADERSIKKVRIKFKEGPESKVQG